MKPIHIPAWHVLAILLGFVLAMTALPAMFNSNSTILYYLSVALALGIISEAVYVLNKFIFKWNQNNNH